LGVEKHSTQLFLTLLGFALGIVEEILFAPFAKRLERKARPNAQLILIVIISISCSSHALVRVPQETAVEPYFTLLLNDKHNFVQEPSSQVHMNIVK
ncbi:MAG: hypothetical protein JWQ25_2956, partial [Daejeonella sp.]|nr:hypothetical protein [Daejeonella sp.]